MIGNGRWVFVCPKEGTVKEQRETDKKTDKTKNNQLNYIY